MLSLYDMQCLSRLEDYYLNPDNFIPSAEDPDEALFNKADDEYTERSVLHGINI